MEKPTTPSSCYLISQPGFTAVNNNRLGEISSCYGRRDAQTSNLDHQEENRSKNDGRAAPQDDVNEESSVWQNYYSSSLRLGFIVGILTYLAMWSRAFGMLSLPARTDVRALTDFKLLLSTLFCSLFVSIFPSMILSLVRNLLFAFQAILSQRHGHLFDPTSWPGAGVDEENQDLAMDADNLDDYDSKDRAEQYLAELDCHFVLGFVLGNAACILVTSFSTFMVVETHFFYLLALFVLILRVNQKSKLRQHCRTIVQ